MHDGCPFYHTIPTPDLIIFTKLDPLDQAFIKSNHETVFTMILKNYQQIVDHDFPQEQELSDDGLIKSSRFPSVKEGLKF